MFGQIVCERSDVFASACAVARAYPYYSRKTNSNNSSLNAVKNNSDGGGPATISVEFFLVGNCKEPLSDEECKMLCIAAESVRTTARIVDTPCNEMHTDAFLDV